MASAFSAPDAAIITHQPELNETLLSSTAAQTGRSIEDLYDIQSTALKLVSRRFQRIALQFPDEALPDSVPIYWALQKAIGLQLQEQGHATPTPDLYILADTSYGNCCVDEVAAQHVDADVVVHYGHACLSPTARLPVIYVFHKCGINTEETTQSLAMATSEALASWDGSQRRAVVLSYDVGYAHAALDVHDKLQAQLSSAASGSQSPLPPLVFSELDTAKNFEARLPGRDGRTPASQDINGISSPPCGCNSEHGCASADTKQASCSGAGCSSSPLPPPQPQNGSHDIDALAGNDGSGRKYSLPSDTTLADCLVLYVGGESLALTNLLLRAGPACPVISYDPQHSSRGTRREDGATNKLLMRRYAAVQKARDASVVGLLVGTLGVQSYLPLLAHLRQMLTGRRPGAKKSTTSTKSRGGRKVYTISVGKLSPAKLANFQEIDVFVLLACPENSLVDAMDPTGRRSKDFYKPIVTPFEMMLALDESRTWTGSYVLEMNQLAVEAQKQEARHGEGGENHKTEDRQSDDEEQEEDDEAPHFSLVTGGYVSRTKYQQHRFGEQPDRIAASDDQNPAASQGSVVLRDASGQLTRILDSASALHLSGRSWTGLEQRLGMDEPSVLEEGRAGIARQYAEADGTKEG